MASSVSVDLDEVGDEYHGMAGCTKHWAGVFRVFGEVAARTLVVVKLIDASATEHMMPRLFSAASFDVCERMSALTRAWRFEEWQGITE